MGRTRVELALVELEEARVHLARLWICATVTIALFGIATLLGIGFVLLLVDATQRVWITAGLCAAFSLAAVVMGVLWARLIHRRRPWLAASLAEWAQDEAELGRNGPNAGASDEARPSAPLRASGP